MRVKFCHNYGPFPPAGQDCGGTFRGNRRPNYQAAQTHSPRVFGRRRPYANPGASCTGPIIARQRPASAILARWVFLPAEALGLRWSANHAQLRGLLAVHRPRALVGGR